MTRSEVFPSFFLRGAYQAQSDEFPWQSRAFQYQVSPYRMKKLLVSGKTGFNKTTMEERVSIQGKGFPNLIQPQTMFIEM
jgi:hypothetical protein